MNKFNPEKDGRLKELHRENSELFASLGNTYHQSKKRRAIWYHIAKSINEEYGTHFTWEQCRKRWQNIKSAAKLNNKKYVSRSGEENLERKPIDIAYLAETVVLGGSEVGDIEPMFEESMPPFPMMMNESLAETNMRKNPESERVMVEINEKPKITEDDIREKQMEVN